jgi:hypothetical protein
MLPLSTKGTPARTSRPHRISHRRREDQPLWREQQRARSRQARVSRLFLLAALVASADLWNPFLDSLTSRVGAKPVIPVRRRRAVIADTGEPPPAALTVWPVLFQIEAVVIGVRLYPGSPVLDRLRIGNPYPPIRCYGRLPRSMLAAHRLQTVFDASFGQANRSGQFADAVRYIVGKLCRDGQLNLGIRVPRFGRLIRCVHTRTVYPERPKAQTVTPPRRSPQPYAFPAAREIATKLLPSRGLQGEIPRVLEPNPTMGDTGLEPVTSALSRRRSPS